MTGGVQFETNLLSSLPSNLDLLNDLTPSIATMSGSAWREKDNIMNDNRPIPSPTYSHLSPVDSNVQSSPYSLPHTVIRPGSAPYQMPYTAKTGSHLRPMPMDPSHYGQHAAAYYPPSGVNTEYDVYHTPGPMSSRVKLSPAPYGEQQTYMPQYDGQQQHGSTPLLTTTTLTRTYDSTIPQYYPVTSDGRWNDLVTPDKARDDTAGQKRKREKIAKDTPPSANKTLKTPKRVKQSQEDGNGRAAKRIRVEEGKHGQSHLPTPPSTGREVPLVSLPRLKVEDADEMMMPIEGSPEVDNTVIRRRGVVVTRVQDEGRRLGLNGAGKGVAEGGLTPEETQLSPRTTMIPALTTDASGIATLSTNEVLESEMAWLESGGRIRSPPSSPDLMQLQTPALTHEIVMSEDTESVATEADRVTKRLQAFVVSKVEEPLVSTRIDKFGRVAVRKNAAVRFLGLDDSVRIVEEIQVEEDDEWVVRNIASGSRTMNKPNWPDAEVPWALAGGSRKERQDREENQKAEILKRYFETASDDGSDEESIVLAPHGKGKAKDIPRFARSSDSGSSSSRRRLDIGRENINADAKDALRVSLRGRTIPSPLLGKVGCVCGAQTAVGMGSMISCSSCKTWHHLVCCGIEDEILGPQWWCGRCSSEAIAMSTPARSTSAFAQSDERSSAFKGELTNIALAPSPMFIGNPSFTQAAASARTPLNRIVGSPSTRNHRPRILSYGSDMWAYTEDGPPTTPATARVDRFSTPRIEDTPFDVTSTPSRHLDFNFSQPSLFAFTPLGARSRVPGSMLEGTPLRARNSSLAHSLADSIGPARHEFFKDLNKGVEQGSPQTWRPYPLLGAHTVSPSPFGHRRNVSGNKLSSLRSSSLSGLGFEVPAEEDE